MLVEFCAAEVDTSIVLGGRKRGHTHGVALLGEKNI